MYTDNGMVSQAPLYWGGTPSPYTNSYAGHAASSTCAAHTYNSPASIVAPSCTTTATSLAVYPSYYTNTYVWPDCGSGYMASWNAFYDDSVTFTVTATNSAWYSTTSAPYTVEINSASSAANTLNC